MIELLCMKCNWMESGQTAKNTLKMNYQIGKKRINCPVCGAFVDIELNDEEFEKELEEISQVKRIEDDTSDNFKYMKSGDRE